MRSTNCALPRLINRCVGAGALLVAGLLSSPGDANAHCQVPCGIYDDASRIHHMREHTATIAKALKMIKTLASKNDAQSVNQSVRWIGVKEAHAEKIIRVVSDYFLTQKIKPVKRAKTGNKAYYDYLTRLVRHHAVLRAAMKCKQTGMESAKSLCVKPLTAAIDGIASYWHK